jgi:hypothetical protein
MLRRHTLLIILVGLLAPACVNELVGVPETEHGDDIDEVTLSLDDLASWETEGEWLISPTLESTAGASRVGLLAGLDSAGELPEIQARATEGGEPIGEWIPLATTWSEEDQHVAIAELGTIAGGAQLRVRIADASALRALRWTATIPAPPALDAPAVEDPEVAGHAEALRSELSGLGIVTRSAWGARATRCTSGDSRKTRIAIHHTVTGSSDPMRQVRGIQAFHMDSRGWCDVGYHFLIGSDGRVYEARPLHLLGAHVGSNNTGNIGISFVGCFHTSGCGGLGPTTPPASMVTAAGRLAGTLSRLYGISISSSTLKGHRDHSGQSTSCPGNNLHSRLGTIRTTAQRETLGGGSPPPAPAPAPPPAGGGSCRHSFGGTYGNLACSTSYQCCSGTWRDRGACGACACVEGSGATGCSARTAPAGAACTHSFGGRYANTACSTSYQCCTGTWRDRGACGSCFCVEGSGSTGCGL